MSTAWLLCGLGVAGVIAGLEFGDYEWLFFGAVLFVMAIVVEQIEKETRGND